MHNPEEGDTSSGYKKERRRGRRDKTNKRVERKTMKPIKKIALLAVAAAMFAGCAKIEYGSDEEVRWDPFACVTKAIVSGTTYPIDVPFTVNAFFSKDNFATSTKWIDSSEMTKQGTYWKNSAQTYYWPISGAMKFFGYSPSDITANAASVTSSAANGTVVADYELTPANATKDFMYASNTTNVATRVKGSPVQMTFAHAMAQIVFKASLAADYPNATVKITDIMLVNIATTGSFRQNPASWYDLSSRDQTYTVLTGGMVTVPYVDGTVVTAPITVCDAILMIPQAMAANTSLRIKYTVTQTTSDGTISPTVDASAVISEPWLMGQRVTYNMQVGLNAITFTATGGQWGTAAGGEIVI